MYLFRYMISGEVNYCTTKTVCFLFLDLLPIVHKFISVFCVHENKNAQTVRNPMHSVLILNLYKIREFQMIGTAEFLLPRHSNDIDVCNWGGINSFSGPTCWELSLPSLMAERRAEINPICRKGKLSPTFVTSFL